MDRALKYACCFCYGSCAVLISALFVTMMWSGFDQLRQALTGAPALLQALVVSTLHTLILVVIVQIATGPLALAVTAIMRWYPVSRPARRTYVLGLTVLRGLPTVVVAILVVPWLLGDGLAEQATLLAFITFPQLLVALDAAQADTPTEQFTAAMALGSTRWRALARVVLPIAKPRLIVAFGRAATRTAAETAPLVILFDVLGNVGTPQPLAPLLFRSDPQDAIAPSAATLLLFIIVTFYALTFFWSRYARTR